MDMTTLYRNDLAPLIARLDLAPDFGMPQCARVLTRTCVHGRQVRAVIVHSRTRHAWTGLLTDAGDLCPCGHESARVLGNFLLHVEMTLSRRGHQLHRGVMKVGA